MKKRLNEDTILNIGFYGGLSLKAINAVIEIIGGLIMLMVSLDWLNTMIKVIALPELREDSQDIIMNYLITLSQNFSITAMHSVAIYMLFHGLTKVIAVWLLWQKKMWAYLPVVGVFILFISYECYSFLHSYSPIMLGIIIIDIAIVVVVMLEYRHLKMEKR